MGDLLTSKLHEEIIKIAAGYGYSTVDEVSILTDSDRHAYSVLQYLRTKGTWYFQSPAPSKAYYLPDDMKKIFVESSGQVKHLENFYPYAWRTMFYHHTSLIKVHLMIQKIFGDKLIDYIPEPRLKRELGKKKVCDGEFIFINRNGEQKKAGVEVELTLKNAEARRERVTSLTAYADTNLNAVIIFYNQAIIKQRTAETLGKHGTKLTPVFFISLPDFLKNGEATEAETLAGEKVSMFKKES